MENPKLSASEKAKARIQKENAAEHKRVASKIKSEDKARKASNKDRIAKDKAHYGKGYADAKKKGLAW